jgi:hypothetical protein
LPCSTLSPEIELARFSHASGMAGARQGDGPPVFAWLFRGSRTGFRDINLVTVPSAVSLGPGHAMLKTKGIIGFVWRAVHVSGPVLVLFRPVAERGRIWPLLTGFGRMECTPWLRQVK